jgi:signal transduction histidine kinase
VDAVAKRLSDANRELTREPREKPDALAHDLRRPLTNARLSAQMLSESPGLPGSECVLMPRILASLDRADRLVSDLLDVHRIQAGE